MLSEYFRNNFEVMPKPTDLTADEARRLIIDTHRLLTTSRLIVNGVPVTVDEENLERNLDILIRLVNFLGGYSALCETLPEDDENTTQNLQSANFVSAQIFEFLAEYQVIERSMTFLPSDTGKSTITGFEFWSDEIRHWINASAHYLLSGHDGNAVTVIRRCRRLRHSEDEKLSSPWFVFDVQEILQQYSIFTTNVVFLILECNFAEITNLETQHIGLWQDITDQQEEIHIVDLATVAVLSDICKACFEIAGFLTTYSEDATEVWIETINHAEEGAHRIQDPSLVWLSSLLRRIFNEFHSRGLLSIRPSSSPPPNPKWLRYLQIRAQSKRALLWPAHIRALQKDYLNPDINSVVSMPPGGGKSFIAEIKIASILEAYFEKGWILYIVPTNALARQVERDLQKALVPHIVPTETDVKRFVTDQEYNFLIDEHLPENPIHYVAIMTPEKLRMALSLFPDSFKNCKFCVVDEAHLIEDKKRGALLELSLSHLKTDFPQIRYLFLSAMMSNPDELAEWLQNGISLFARWRSTRQAMMLGIPDVEDIKKSSRKGIAGESDLYFASVYDSAWEFDDSVRLIFLEKFSLFKSSQQQYKFLATETARNCALASTKMGLKTLLYLPHTYVEASAAKLGEVLNIDMSAYTNILNKWDRVLKRELGEEDIQLVQDLRLGVCYHKSSMHQEEQNLAEYFFSQVDNVKIMVATSTLSQGMNLPVENLIFAGDSRFDPELDQPVKLTAKDFFNIAGRSGRPAFANQGIVQVIPNWKMWEPLRTQYDEIREIYLAVSEDDFLVGSGLDNILDQIENIPSFGELRDDASAIATAWFGRLGDEQLLRNTYAFYLNSKNPKVDLNVRAKKISLNLVNWVNKQEQEFPLSTIAEEAFRRSGLPSRTCRHLYQSAQDLFNSYVIDKSEETPNETSFYDWFDILVPFIQNEQCDFFFSPRVRIGDTKLRNDFETVWQYEEKALIGWLQGNRIFELLRSDFVQGKKHNMVIWRDRAVKFMQRTTQQYAFAFGSLLFFIECVWRDEDPLTRGWGSRTKELGMKWDPYLIHLPLAVKWGLDSLSGLVWRIQRVRFRFAARILGELYPINQIDDSVRKRFGVFLSDNWKLYQNDPDRVIDIFKTRRDIVGINLSDDLLKDVAEACFGLDLRY